MCYCPDPSPSLVYVCSTADQFTAMAGQLTVLGPVARNFFCLAGHSCVFTVEGQNISDADQVSFGPCQDRDETAFLNTSWRVVNQQVRLPPSAVPRGGVWSICYCSARPCDEVLGFADIGFEC